MRFYVQTGLKVAFWAGAGGTPYIYGPNYAPKFALYFFSIFWRFITRPIPRLGQVSVADNFRLALFPIELIALLTVASPVRQLEIRQSTRVAAFRYRYDVVNTCRHWVMGRQTLIYRHSADGACILSCQYRFPVLVVSGAV
jgi:hypothetical protein